MRAPQEFARAIHIYIDLGSKAALETDIKCFAVDEIERQLIDNYSVDVYEHNFVRGTYDLEVKRFRSSFKAAIYKKNKEELDERVMARLDELVSNKPEHLRRSIQARRTSSKAPNYFHARQCGSEGNRRSTNRIHNSARDGKKLGYSGVYLCAPAYIFPVQARGRPSGYPHKVFTILPPRPELVIEKRLVFALKIAEGGVSPEVLHGVILNLGNIAAFIRVMLHSIRVNSDLKEILSNITAGNIRAVVEFVTHFDTPIFDQDTQDRIVEKLGSFDIVDRYERALAFRNYLSATWESSGLRPEYFDWNESVREGQEDFTIVLLAIEAIVRKRNSAATSQ